MLCDVHFCNVLYNKITILAIEATATATINLVVKEKMCSFTLARTGPQILLNYHARTFLWFAIQDFTFFSETIEQSLLLQPLLLLLLLLLLMRGFY